jgi:hypothetical protein
MAVVHRLAVHDDGDATPELQYRDGAHRVRLCQFTRPHRAAVTATPVAISDPSIWRHGEVITDRRGTGDLYGHAEK